MALQIREAIDYPFAETFGRPNASHAVRSVMFDRAIRQFATAHLNVVVVNPAERLETQRERLADLNLEWFSVDLPPLDDFARLLK